MNNCGNCKYWISNKKDNSESYRVSDYWGKCNQKLVGGNVVSAEDISFGRKFLCCLYDPIEKLECEKELPCMELVSI